MVEYLRKEYKIKKIVIIDIDCYYGDGMQDIFWNDKDVLFIFLYQDGIILYFGIGFIDEIGGFLVIGYILNLFLLFYIFDEGFLYCLDNFIIFVLEEFKFDIIINLVGQDNYYFDLLINMNFFV